MSIVVSTPAQICNSPLNNSKSKMLFSFPKSKKIAEVRKSDCAQAFYDLPPVRDKRAAAFGYGTKYDFTKGGSKTPAPNVYNVQKSFDEVNKKMGFSFGLSREQMLVTGGQYIGDKASPGPGAYDIRGINKTTISYSFRPRTTVENLISSKHVPGPGAYGNIDNINKTGKYVCSKYKNSGATIISPARSGRFSSSVNKSNEPGPGSYDLKTGINTTGSYFVSKFKSNIARSFGHSLRKTASENQLSSTPGPGSYRLPSEFGYYESGKVHKALRNGGERSTEKSPEKKNE